MVQVVELTEVDQVLLQEDQEPQNKETQVAMLKAETQGAVVELELLVQLYLLQHPLLILVVLEVLVQHLLFQVHLLLVLAVELVVLLLVLMAHHGQQQAVQVVADKVEDMLLVPHQKITHKQLQEQQTLEVVVGQQPKDMVLQVWQVVQVLL